MSSARAVRCRLKCHNERNPCRRLPSGALAEIIRYFFKYDTLKGIRWSFVPFALSFFTYTLHWWTDTEGSLAAAVAEMRPGYDELMKPVIDNIPMLIVVIVLTIPVAILAMRLAERALKNQTALLKQ